VTSTSSLSLLPLLFSFSSSVMFSGSCPGWVFGAGSEAPGCHPGSSDCGVVAVGPEVTGGWPDAACCFVVDAGVTGSCPNSLGDPESSKLFLGGINSNMKFKLHIHI
jgi:hypothetical protein